MMDIMTNNQLFGVILTIISFEIGKYLFNKTQTPLLTPLLVAQIIIILILQVFKIPTERYFLGANMIEFFIGPVAVVLAVPLYKNINLLKKHMIPVFVGAFFGSITAIVSVILFGKLLGLDNLLIVSFVPKSVTTPIGLEIVNMMGGIPAITALCITITGIIGNVTAPYICKVFRINHPVAVGIGIGVSSHVVGTAKAMEIGEVEGSMSSLAISIAGLITLFLAPIIKLFF